MNKQNSVVINGLNAETLTMIRTRFILDWDKTYAEKFPFRLFEHQEQFLAGRVISCIQPMDIWGSRKTLPIIKTG